MKKLLLPIGLLLSAGAFAQNVGINATGAAPVTSAALDVDMANKGILIPRVALTTTTAFAPVTGTATASLLVYNTATAGTFPSNVTPGYYYWTGTAWARLINSGTSWELLGNQGTNPTVNFLGTTDNVNLVFRTNNTARAMIYNTGEALFNPIAAAFSGDILTARAENAQYGVNGYLTGNGGGNAGYFQNSNTSTASGAITTITTTPGYNAYFQTTSTANTFPAAVAINQTTTGIAISGGVNAAGTYPSLAGGVGAIFNHPNAGVFASTANGGNGTYGGYFANSVTFAYVGYRTGGTNYKINGPGTVATMVDDMNGKKVNMFCPEAPEVLFQDYGTGVLNGGSVHITIDPILAKNIFVDDTHPLKVFIQLEGECKGVYVTNKSANGFDVVELQGGTSNTPFSWTIVANRIDTKNPDGTIDSRFQDVRFPDSPPRLEPVMIEGRNVDELKKTPLNNQ